MTKMVRQTAFLAGEADQALWKRTDIEEYLTAARSLLNCEVGTTGLARKRKGTTYKVNATTEAIFNSTMYEFVDKNNNYYIVLAADEVFYVFSTPAGFTNLVDYQSNLVINYLGQQIGVQDDTINLLQTVVTPYNSQHLAGLDYTQDNDSLILTSPSYRPGRLFVSSYSPLTFAYEPLAIYPLPAFDFGVTNYNAATVVLSTTVVGGTGTLTIAFTIPGLAAGTYTNAWVGGQIIGGGISELAPIGYAIITAVSQIGTTVTFTAIVQIAFQTTAYSTLGTQYSIRQPAWVNEALDPYGLGYPAKVVYFQNRLWFANTRLLPGTIFGSKINQPVSFDVGTGKDTDAIIYTIGQTSSGAIQWLNGGKQLEIFTINYEFAAPQTEESGLTPSTFSIRQQSSYGSSMALKPQTYLNDSYFVQKTGKAAINFHFTGVGLAYASTNVAPQSQHLMKNPNNRALLRGTDISQDNFIYLLNESDNTITAFQFATEIKLAALTPITFKDDVRLIDIVTCNNEVYLLKYYSLTQQFSLEVMQSGVFIDSSESHLMLSSGVVSGLSRFEGYKVQVVYAGQDFGEYTVVDNSILVRNPLQQQVVVQIGLLYDVEITPMYPFFGSTSAAFMKQVSRIYIDYYESLNFKINGKLVQYQNFQEIQEGLPLTPKTDTAIFSPVTGYSRFPSDDIVITQTSPFDLQILSIGYQIDMAVI